MTLRILLAGLALTGCACIDPEAKYESFLARRGEALADAGTEDAGSGNADPLEPEQLAGEYLLAISLANFADTPTVFQLEVDAEADGEDILIRVRQRALSALDRRTPVEEYSPWRTDRVTRAGVYTSERVQTVVPAAANPVAPLEAATDTVLSGVISNPKTDEHPDAPVEFYCGVVTGTVSVGPTTLDAAGSTFASQRITDSDQFPPVVINCAKEPAKALE